MKLGQTFVNKETDNAPSHLWMVLSDPEQNSKVVIANLSTRRENDPDPPCIVAPGEHPYVSRESVVRFDQVRVVEVKQLDQLLKDKLLSPAKDLSPALLRKVQRALGESPLVPNAAKEILRQQGFIQNPAA